MDKALNPATARLLVGLTITGVVLIAMGQTLLGIALLVLVAVLAGVLRMVDLSEDLKLQPASVRHRTFEPDGAMLADEADATGEDYWELAKRYSR